MQRAFFVKFMKIRLLLYVTVGMLLISCNQVKKGKDKAIDMALHQIVEFLSTPSIKEYSLFDRFPELAKDEFGIVEFHGVLCDYPFFFYKYYFTYSGNRELIQQYISNIQCRYSEIVPDTAFIKSDFTHFEKQTQNLAAYEYKKANFFFAYKDTNPEELEFYTCTKTPETHYIIFNTKSGLIYHLIENFRE